MIGTVSFSLEQSGQSPEPLPLWIAAICCLSVALLFGLLEETHSLGMPAPAPTATLAACSKPPPLSGLQRLGVHEVSWAPSYFGPGSSWHRAIYIDPHMTKAHAAAAVDLVTDPRPALLNVYVPPLTYESALGAIEDGHDTLADGVVANRYYTNSNELVRRSNLSWLMLSFSWHVAHGASNEVERAVVTVPQDFIGGNKLAAPVAPLHDGVFIGSVDRVLRSSPTYTIAPSGSVDHSAIVLANEVLAAANAGGGACR